MAKLGGDDRMNPDRYYYRRQARIVYKQPVGKPYSEAALTIWTSSCEMAERLVVELERLRRENLTLFKRLGKRDITEEGACL